MESGISLSNPMILSAGGAVLIALLVAVFLYWRWSRSTPVRIKRALKQISHDMLEDIYLPDGMDGHIHVEMLLLTNNGFLVLDIRDIPGVIFGAEKMDEWVVMQSRKRHTFRNPLHALRDRLAVVRAHAKDVFTDGYVVFADAGRFEKGTPVQTVVLRDLVQTVGPAGDDYPQAFADAWRKISAIAERDNTLPPVRN